MFSNIPKTDLHSFSLAFKKYYSQLPEALQQLTDKFCAALEALEHADRPTKKRLLPILSKTSALISAEISKVTELSQPIVKTDRLKMLELEAKARLLKITQNT